MDGSDRVARVTLVLVLALAHRMAASFEGPREADLLRTMLGDGAIMPLHEGSDSWELGVPETLQET